jgi:hypothetical protein
MYPVPRQCVHGVMLILSRTTGGRRVVQPSLEPLPVHAEQMIGELTVPDPLHAVHVSSVTPILLATRCASAGFLPGASMLFLPAQPITYRVPAAARARAVLSRTPGRSDA